MRHRKKGKKLSRKAGHRDKLIRNLLTRLFEHGQIETTLAKAKAVKPRIDKVVTIAKKDTPPSRERLKKMLFSQEAFDNIYNKYKDDLSQRDSGYSRIIRLRRRPGDNSQIVLIDLLVDDSKKSVLEKKDEKSSSKNDQSKSEKQTKNEKDDSKSFWDRFGKKKDQEEKKVTKKTDKTAKTIKKEPTQRTTSK
jgi:large subunit ribosomal protein L17